VGESVRAAHIVKHINEDVSEQQAREAIDQAKAELDAGANFEELADRVSDCPGNGGDLGWFGHGKMVDEFEAVVFAMEPGQVSDVFKSVFGFHIAKLHEKKPPTSLPLSEVKDRIAAELKQERENQLVESLVDGLRASAKIEVREPVKA
jgi:parvulin-like peptidyl-prolyl isomerase